MTVIDLVKLAEVSHLAKLFDGSVIPNEKIDLLRAVLRSAPSSLNIQATHYVVAASPMARARIGKAVQNGFELNEAKIQTASHVFVFCSRTSLSAEHMDDVAWHEHSDGRFPNAETEGRWRELVKGGLAAHEFDFQDLPHWVEKQTYLALGIALMVAAELDVDALPMEGFHHNILDEELDLNERGYTSTVLLALGRQSKDDYIRRTPKSRLPEDQLFTDLG
jgi:nitroreductase/dihydropteridine reductase